MGMASTTTTMSMRLQFPGSVNRNQASFLGVPLRLPYEYRQSSLPSLFLNVQAKASTRREDRHARHSRIRKKVEGTPERPRLCVFRSNKHLSVQVIDDSKRHTLASASTMQKPICEEFNYSSGPTIVLMHRTWKWRRRLVKSLQNPVWKKESQRWLLTEVDIHIMDA